MDERTPSELEDIDLMLRASKDDLDAFSALVRKHEQALMNFFARNGVFRDVEDLAQQTFLKLYRARATYRPSAKFTTYLYLLARQVLIDSVRASERHSALHERAGQEMPVSEEPPATRGETGDAETALASLSPELREAVVLVVMQGFPYADAAEILGVPVGTVKSRIHAALEKMRKVLNLRPRPQD